MSQGESFASLLSELKTHDIQIEPTWTGEILRNGPQWFIGKSWTKDGKTYSQAWFGDYKRDLKFEWKSWEKLTKAEQTEADNQAKEMADKARAELEKNWVIAAEKCKQEWETFSSEGTSPYLTRKSIAQLFGTRIRPNPGHDPIVCVPLYDINGKLWNYQRIYSQKLSKGDKFFADEARIEGLFHVVDRSPTEAPPTDLPIYIAEGFATAASIHAAFGGKAFVVTAFNAGNLQAVATTFREKYSSNDIVICADNDAYTVINNKPYNVGIEKGRRAAGSVRGEVVYPIFKYPQKGLTDFNDLHCTQGLDSVRDVILNFGNYVVGIQPMCLTTTKTGKPIVPSEPEVCEYLLKFFGGRIVRQDKSLFRYVGTHWVELGPTEIDKIKQMIGVATNKLLGAREIETFYKYFYMHAPVVPYGVNMYQPNPCAANFTNGTLHCTLEPGGKFKAEFRKHDPSDYLTSCLPFEMPDWKDGEELPPAPLFDAMIERLWASNSDKEQSKLLAYELVGAALMPAFPIIVIYHGLPNSGKSTLIKLIVKLVDKQNVSSVQLCDMHGFNMESMIGKLVNFDTDIDVNKPMNDSEVKKLIDRVPRRIRRKGIADVYAHLPALHLFAANKPPKTLDGSSHAYGRRMILVHTQNVIQGERTLDYESVILRDEMPGVLARGLSGLYRLLNNNGLYTIPETSKEQVRNLEMESDLVGQFLEDVREGEVRTEKSHKVVMDTNAQIGRPELWVAFDLWQRSTNPRGNWLGKHEFFDKVRMRGIGEKKVKGVRYFDGIGVLVQADSVS